MYMYCRCFLFQWKCKTFFWEPLKFSKKKYKYYWPQMGANEHGYNKTDQTKLSLDDVSYSKHMPVYKVRWQWMWLIKAYPK